MLELKQQIESVLKYSQGLDKVNIDKLYEQWKQAKEYYYYFLGKQCIYEYPEKLSFELDSEGKQERFRNFVNYTMDLMEEYGENCSTFSHFLRMVGAESFYKNRIGLDHMEIPNEEKFFDSDSKLIKSFKYFIEDHHLLETLQNKASELIQENKIEGYLCISVHPLDYLSLSENNFNWRSCHALDGEYRAGNLSYMLDRDTIVCYLKSKEDTVLPHFPASVPWNNKKWRCLLFVDDSKQMIFAGRQYPFAIPKVLEKIRDIFMNIVYKDYNPVFSWQIEKDKLWSHWHNKYLNHTNIKYDDNDPFAKQDNPILVEEDRYLITNSAILDKNKIIEDVGHLHFDDLIRSSVYLHPWYMYKRNGPMSDIHFTIGADVPCICCGKISLNSCDTEDLMICDNCYEVPFESELRSCNYCGFVTNLHGLSYLDKDDMFICQDCLDGHTAYCILCGERHLIDNLSDGICTWCAERNENNG